MARAITRGCNEIRDLAEGPDVRFSLGATASIIG
jgi:hypothetical protein